MIQLKINNLDHKAILTVPADYERVVSIASKNAM